MPSKPRTDEERRAWLQLSGLKGERDRLQHERNQLRQQLMAVLSLGDLWPGIPAQELRDRPKATVDAWEATVAEGSDVRTSARLRRSANALLSSRG